MAYSFTKEEILKAIDYLDQHPEEFKGRASSTYDLVYEGKKYPPILVLSKANELKDGKTLLLSDFDNSTEKAFKYLNDNGFTIIAKSGNETFAPYLRRFLRQSLTNNLKSKDYSIIFKDTKVKASFGQGATANVPWVSFTLEPNTTSK